MLVVFIAFLLIFVGLIYYFTFRVQLGHRPLLRRIQGFESIQGLLGQAVEAGRSLHVSLGLGSMGNQTTADSLAGLYVMRYIGQQAAATGIPPTVSMADPTVLLFAQAATQAAHAEDSAAAREAYRQLYWLAPQPAAYAAGVINILNTDPVHANVMVGDFGDEYLLMGETAVRNQIAHIGGASDPNTLPFIYVSAEETLLGEEIYAAGAYLQKYPSHIASLLAQDTMRWLVGLFIIISIILVSLGINLPWLVTP